MNKAVSYFTNGFRMQRQSVLLKRSLYVLLVIKCLQWLSLYDLLFGESSMITRIAFSNLMPHQELAFVLYQLKSPYAAYLFIGPTLLIAIAGIFKLRSMVSDLLLWLLVVNIHNSIYATMTGGEILLNQLLLFASFVRMQWKLKNEGGRQWWHAFHNAGNTAVILQVCLLYFFSAFAKIQDPAWKEGTALIQTLQTDQYSNPFLHQCTLVLPWLFIGLNYMVLSYQLLFPVLVWIPSIKRPFISFGILMHLFIALGMGLMSFGCIMILSYIYFWPMKEK